MATCFSFRGFVWTQYQFIVIRVLLRERGLQTGCRHLGAALISMGDIGFRLIA
jgi:hypothetical protein